MTNLDGKVSLIGGVCTFMTSPYLKESPPPPTPNVAYYLEITISITIHEILCNTDRYMYSFFPDSTRSWNNIVINFQCSPLIGTFKKNIFSLIRPTPKSTFGIHDPQGIKHLLQLSVGLSPLRHHKKNTISLIHPMIGVIVFVLQKTPNTFCYTVIYNYPEKNSILQSQTY